MNWNDVIQEVAHYIDRVYECWSSICGAHPETVTICTARRLEGRYPQLSSQDASYITERFDNFDVFETVRDKQKRSEVLSSVLRYPGRILSLRLLIEDTKILEPAARIMKYILPECSSESIKASMEACFRIRKASFSPVEMERRLESPTELLTGTETRMVLWSESFGKSFWRLSDTGRGSRA